MLFTSVFFIYFFFPFVFFIQLFAPARLKNPIILIASLFFYFYGEGPLISLLILSIAVNYAFGRLLQNAPFKLAKFKISSKFLLFWGLVFNLGMLGWYKYANFFVIDILQADSQAWQKIALPIGISFFTFQAISYLIDIYCKRIACDSNIISYGAYISCFPQLIAGPIVRYSEIRRDLAERKISFDDIYIGIKRFIIGFGKKMLIANPLGWAADQVYAMPVECVDGPHAWLAILCYGLQIYYDFSGYSDMAIGLGRMLGFHFPENFNFPYAACSIREFWRRWHMTLTAWLRDYVYIPLGGNKKGQYRAAVNKWIVFLLCGLWHGASWNFIVWGAYHGCFLVMEGFIGKKLKFHAPQFISHCYLLLAVFLGWVIFRAEDLPQAWRILLAAFGLNNPEPYALSIQRLWRWDIIMAIALGLLGSFPVIRLLEKYLPFKAAFKEDMALVLLTIIFILACSCTIATTFNPFLYFRF